MKYPTMIKTNARYRGPMESRKLSNAIRDIYESMNTVRQMFIEQNKDGGALRQEVFKRFNHDLAEQYKTMIQNVSSMKGGDL